MSFKIETIRSRNRVTLRISGRLRCENLLELKKQVETDPARTVLDISEVTLVDVEVVHFLNACQDQGAEIANISPYIREWMNRERNPESQ
jgi:hypothetical protein